MRNLASRCVIRSRDADMRPALKMDTAQTFDRQRDDVADVALHDPFEAVAQAEHFDAVEPRADRGRGDDAVQTRRRSAAAENCQFVVGVHMVWAQVTWLSRWRPETPRFKTKSSELPDLASIRSTWNDVNREMRLLLDGLDDGQLASKDDSDDFPLGMQLIHLANHQTYHRGEIAALLTRYGCSPGELDINRWVVWKRKS